MPASSRFSVSRILAVTLGTILMAGTQLVMPAASAAPPDNDDIGGAVDISTIPFTDVVDTSEATNAAGDSGCGAATVWYTFTPAVSGSYDLTTAGSNYDTTLALFQGTADNLSIMECNDDRTSPDGPLSGIRAELTAGTTYYVEAGTCCWSGDVGQVGPGGTLQLNVAETRALGLHDVTWDRIRITGDTTGVLYGLVACTGVELVFVQGTVRQRTALNVAQSDFWAGGECSDGEFAVEASLDFGSRVLLPKRATVTADAYSCDPFGCDSDPSTTAVRVTRR